MLPSVLQPLGPLPKTAETMAVFFIKQLLGPGGAGATGSKRPEEPEEPVVAAGVLPRGRRAVGDVCNLHDAARRHRALGLGERVLKVEAFLLEIKVNVVVHAPPEVLGPPGRAVIDHTAPNSRDVFVLWRVYSEGRFVPDACRESISLLLASVLQAASPRLPEALGQKRSGSYLGWAQ